MMEYKVIALYVNGLGNNMYKSGDIVKEINFPPGRAKELVSQGFLRPLHQPQTPSVPRVKSFDDFTSKELRNELTKRGRSFKPNANKKELYRLLNS